MKIYPLSMSWERYLQLQSFKMKFKKIVLHDSFKLCHCLWP